MRVKEKCFFSQPFPSVHWSMLHLLTHGRIRKGERQDHQAIEMENQIGEKNEDWMCLMATVPLPDHTKVHPLT